MKYKLFNLKANTDDRGSLVALESSKDIPFDISRVFYIYGNKDRKPRAGHANITSEEVIICLNGSCRIFLDDGNVNEYYFLDSPEQAIYIPSNIWVEIDRFSQDCILLVLASNRYIPLEQIWDYQKFKELIK